MIILAFAINTARQASMPEIMSLAALDLLEGANATPSQRRWRLFFLPTMGLLGHNSGDLWVNGQYLMAPTA